MTIDEHIKYWIDSADYDLESAFDIYNTKRYVWSLFVGHLALEKILKAIYVKSSGNKVPPKIHNLTKLAELSNLNLNEEQFLFLDYVNNFQLEARYAEFKHELYKLATESFTFDNLNKIKEQYLWFKSLLK